MYLLVTFWFCFTVLSIILPTFVFMKHGNKISTCTAARDDQAHTWVNRSPFHRYASCVCFFISIDSMTISSLSKANISNYNDGCTNLPCLMSCDNFNKFVIPRTILNFCFVWTVTGIKTASIHLHWVSRYLCKMIPYVWLYFSALTIFVFCRRLEPIQQGPTKTNTKGVTHTHLLHVHVLWSLENV